MMERIAAMFRLSKLKNRLRVYFMCFLILLILSISLPIAFIGKQQGVVDVKDEMEQMIDLQQIFIEHWFEENLADVRSFAQLPVVKNKDLVEMQQVFKKFHDNYTKFDAIVFANADGITEVANNGESKVDITARQYYRQAVLGNTYVSEVLVGKKSHEPIIIFSVPVYDDSESFQGLVFGSVKLETIQDVMAQFQNESGETYLISRDGHLITTSRQGEIGDEIHTEILKAALKGDEAKDFYKVNDGSSVIGTYRWVNQGKWLIVGEVKEKEIYQPLLRLAKILGTGLFVLMVISYFGIIWISNLIEKGVRYVLEGTRKIGEGKWGYRLNNKRWNIDEFKELGHNFNEMATLIENHMVSLAKSEERFRMITQYSSDVISIHDAEGLFTYISPAGKEVLHYEDEEIIGYHIFDFIHKEDLEMIKEHYQQLLLKGHFVSTYRVRRKDGQYIWLESSIRRLQIDPLVGIKTYVISRNISERKKVEEKLKETNKILQSLSTKDGLTSIWNRRSFDESIKEKWTEAILNQTPLSLILLDVDYFKKFNDTYGHQAGDECLKSLAGVLDQVEQEFGVKAYRYGGEEFSLILPNTTATEVDKIAKQLVKTVEE